jgi:hypothetical protein
MYCHERVPHLWFVAFRQLALQAGIFRQGLLLSLALTHLCAAFGPPLVELRFG